MRRVGAAGNGRARVRIEDIIVVWIDAVKVKGSRSQSPCRKEVAEQGLTQAVRIATPDEGVLKFLQPTLDEGTQPVNTSQPTAAKIGL